jgi:putative transposase
MARHSRIVAHDMPHHIKQRGNRRQNVFFCDDDYELYINLMAEWCARAGVEIWAYRLMTNHVHLIAVPQTAEALAAAIAEAHRCYTIEINRRNARSLAISAMTGSDSDDARLNK